MFTMAGIDKFVTIHDEWNHAYCENENNMTNLASRVYWPGCGNNFTKGSRCGEPCFSASWLQEIIEFNEKQDPGQIVRYNNRPGKGEDDKDIEMVELGGWLLPAAKSSNLGHPRPRIVVQHGFTSNSNKMRQLAITVMYRQLGFDVLVNNFRDHCYSADSSTHITEWGHAYPYDLLGAVDYMRNDPDNKLGGSVEAGKVGIMGISMGAFTTVNAFGIDGEVPAAWADGPPATPKSVFADGARNYVVSMGLPLHIASMLVDTIWKNVEDYALSKGVDLNEHLPADVLPTGPDTERPFTIVSNVQDTTVPIAEAMTITHVAQSFPKKYQTQMWQADGTCNEANHCVDHITHWDEYKARSCLFWYKVFGIDTKDCPALPQALGMKESE